MKITKSLLAAICLIPASLNAELITAPVGTIDIDNNLVRTGQKPRVSWSIVYPTPLDDIVTISEPGTITVKTRTEVEMRVVGVAFQSGSQLLPASLQTQVNGGNWQPLFAGDENAVDPSTILYKKTAEAGTTINLSAAGGDIYGGWSFSASTLSVSPQVTPLRDGDLVPNYVPAYNQANIENYLSGYISEDNEVTIGPRDLIYLFELGTTNPNSAYFDMQDIAVVITFKEITEITSN